MKLIRIFENKRRIANQQFSRKGGRPRNDDDSIDEGPTCQIPRNNGIWQSHFLGVVQSLINQIIKVDFSELDMVSYDENVNKLLEVVNGNRHRKDVGILRQLTYEDRRREITEGHYSDIYDLMKNHCPLLNQVNYVRTTYFQIITHMFVYINCENVSISSRMSLNRC